MKESREDRAEFERIFRALEVIDSHLHKIMATQAESAAQVTTLTAQVTKIGTESRTLLTKIDELLALIAGGSPNTSPELQAAIDALQAQVQVVDDLVPDAPPSTP